MSTSAQSSAETDSTAARSGGTVTDRLVELNGRYSEAFSDPGMDARPVLHVAVVACMDARLDLHAALGLELGDCHTIRNAGGVVTDDVIRSLTISQRALGTRSVILIHHTNCGLESLTEGFRQELELEVGQRPVWAVEAYTDADRGRTAVDAAGAHLAVPPAHGRHPRVRLRRDHGQAARDPPHLLIRPSTYGPHPAYRSHLSTGE